MSFYYGSLDNPATYDGAAYRNAAWQPSLWQKGLKAVSAESPAILAALVTESLIMDYHNYGEAQQYNNTFKTTLKPKSTDLNLPEDEEHHPDEEHIDEHHSDVIDPDHQGERRPLPEGQDQRRPVPVQPEPGEKRRIVPTNISKNVKSFSTALDKDSLWYHKPLR